ncbi:hypothetical protein HY967_01505 [Candidatus Jorgensenbacteria bacterium]|nr:hypothetical protein [Candidatus Jorgensenbacteria bacterium]
MATDILTQGYESLGADINKRPTDGTQETKEGIVSQKLPELTLEMSDDDIIKLTNKWEKDWKDSSAKQEWEKQIEENEKYWLGKHYDLPKADKSRPIMDNAIFEALETYLPQATRRNPEPLVILDPKEVGVGEHPDPKKLQYVDKVKNKLSDIADKIKLRLKLKKTARHWAISQLGVIKFGWDLDRDIPAVRVVRPKKIILDPESMIDEDGYTGNRIGEYRKMEASKILAIIGADEKESEAKKAIIELVNENNLATEINFIEWWTPQYFCWKLGDKILLKNKNPHWNYDKEATQENVDTYGNPTSATEMTQGINHLPVPDMPYRFLSVFSLGDQPMDKTSLIQQNLSNQDLLNKRNKQIDKNADGMNGGMVVSLARSGLTQAQAKNVTSALSKGGTVVIPDGAPREAIDRYPAPGLPNDVYNQLVDIRSRLRDIFGVSGATPAGIRDETTVGGKIITKSLDTDRIGGGVTEYLEQLSDDIYNWILQLLYVYDTDFQFIPGAVPPKVSISVKEGSLLPKDSIAIANQALELARINRISNVDLYKRLDYPNPEEMAANIWLETNAPQLLYRDNQLVQEALAMQQEAQQTSVDMKNTEEKTKHQRNLETELLKGELRSAPPAVPNLSQ